MATIRSKRKKWTRGPLQKLHDLYPTEPLNKVAIACGHTKAATKTRAAQLGVKKDGLYIDWTEAKKQYLIKHYPDTKTEKIAEYLEINICSVYRMATRLHIKKSKEFYTSDESGRLNALSSIGFNHRFKKGHVPPNKGKKWSEYLSLENQEKLRKSLFKKGQLPPNTLYDGAIRLRTNKRTGNAYYYIRLSKAKWKQLHRYIWEKKNGPVPKGHVIAFCDGDSMFCVLSNLMMITMRENRLRNTGWYKKDDKYITQLITRQNRKPANKEMAKMILENFPELITLKRAQLLLNKTIKQHDTAIKKRPNRSR